MFLGSSPVASTKIGGFYIKIDVKTAFFIEYFQNNCSKNSQKWLFFNGFVGILWEFLNKKIINI